jgi:hypothetical protein
MILTFAYAAAVAALLGLPADHTRCRATATAVFGAVAVAARVG